VGEKILNEKEIIRLTKKSASKRRPMTRGQKKLWKGGG